MTRLQVEVEDFVDAARIMYGRVAEPVRVSVGRLDESLSGLSAMAGDDPGGLDWAQSYDGAARTTMQATQQIVNAAYTTSSMFGRSGLNYAQAEAGSTASGSQPASTSALIQRLPPTGFTGPARVPPSASGGGGDTPTGWWLVQHTVGYVWPNGHQQRLHDAAASWRASAAALDEAAFEPVLAGVGFARDRLPEADDIVPVCRGMNERLQELAAAHRSLADACTALARHIDECHSAVESELTDLIAWTAGIQTVGVIASIFSFGAAEAPTQAAQAAKIAEAAVTIGNLIAKFVVAAKTVAAAIAPVAAATERIRATLETLASTRLAVAGISAVPAITRTARVAKNTVRLTKQARAEIAATKRLETEAGLVSRAPAIGRASDFKPPKIFRNRHGQLTNGEFTVSPKAMAPHTRGSLAGGKSQFFGTVDADKAVLDAAAYAKKHNLIDANGKARVFVENGPVGVSGGTGSPTHWINVYVTKSGSVHGCPGSPG